MAPQVISTGFASWLRLLQRRRLTEVSQTLHEVWSSPGLVHYICIFGGSCPVTEFCQVQYSLCVQVLRSHILAALLHGTRAVGISQTLRRSNEPIIKSEKSIFLCTLFLAATSCPSICPYDVILASLGRI